ncbi:MAG: hypothetical protein JWM83_3308 [Candidatus Angelobacter sp.]|jgi:hypothetical protein|nr:hypothetical protein [Candidatus Angelobacter sp.]
MDDDQKWLEAAAAIEQDIRYLKAAMSDGQRNGVPSGLDQELLHLNVVLGIYLTNAATGIAFPNPDDLFCINSVPYGARQATTAMRRSFKTASF